MQLQKIKFLVDDNDFIIEIIIHFFFQIIATVKAVLIPSIPLLRYVLQVLKEAMTMLANYFRFCALLLQSGEQCYLDVCNVRMCPGFLICILVYINQSQSQVKVKNTNNLMLN